MTFKLEIDKQVYKDLDDAIEYHSETKVKTILSAFEKTMRFLEQNPFFSVRYKNIRCLPLGKKLPYMLHFTINEASKTVYVHALISTNKDPDTSWLNNPK